MERKFISKGDLNWNVIFKDGLDLFDIEVSAVAGRYMENLETQIAVLTRQLEEEKKARLDETSKLNTEASELIEQRDGQKNSFESEIAERAKRFVELESQLAEAREELKNKQEIINGEYNGAVEIITNLKKEVEALREGEEITEMTEWEADCFYAVVYPGKGEIHDFKVELFNYPCGSDTTDFEDMGITPPARRFKLPTPPAGGE